VVSEVRRRWRRYHGRLLDRGGKHRHRRTAADGHEAACGLSGRQQCLEARTLVWMPVSKGGDGSTREVRSAIGTRAVGRVPVERDGRLGGVKGPWSCRGLEECVKPTPGYWGHFAVLGLGVRRASAASQRPLHSACLPWPVRSHVEAAEMLENASTNAQPALHTDSVGAIRDNQDRGITSRLYTTHRSRHLLHLTSFLSRERDTLA
jgi:hypothetical protein